MKLASAARDSSESKDNASLALIKPSTMLISKSADFHAQPTRSTTS
jgi:hypothetical protein